MLRPNESYLGKHEELKEQRKLNCQRRREKQRGRERERERERGREPGEKAAVPCPVKQKPLWSHKKTLNHTDCGTDIGTDRGTDRGGGVQREKGC